MLSSGTSHVVAMVIWKFGLVAPKYANSGLFHEEDLCLYFEVMLEAIKGKLSILGIALRRSPAATIVFSFLVIWFFDALLAFGDPIPWQIALVFFFARGFINIGLENHVARQFVKLFGFSTLSLSYGLVFSKRRLIIIFFKLFFDMVLCRRCHHLMRPSVDCCIRRIIVSLLVASLCLLVLPSSLLQMAFWSSIGVSSLCLLSSFIRT